MTSALTSGTPASHSRESPQIFKHRDGPPRPLPKEEESGTRERVEEKYGPSPQKERDGGNVPFWNLRTSSKRAASARGFAVVVGAVGRGAQGSSCKGAVGQDTQRAKTCEGPVHREKEPRASCGKRPTGSFLRRSHREKRRPVDDEGFVAKVWRLGLGLRVGIRRLGERRISSPFKEQARSTTSWA